MVGKCGVLDSDNPKFLDGLRARERRRTKCRDTSSAGKLRLIALVGISVLPNGEKYKMSSISRRTFTKLAFAMGATAAFGDEAGLPSRIAWRERRDLFPEGVASGNPDSSSVLLWTRYPRAGEERTSELLVEIAEDQLFHRVTARANISVRAASDWACRVLVGRLKPAELYWYRLTDKDGNGSRVGRTITAPGENDARPVSFRVR